MESRLLTPGPYRATKLWNDITKYFRAGMPRKKHRQHFKKHGNCFTATEAIDWLHELLRNNSNFGPEVTRQQTVQLLRKFLKNHVIEDIKGRWGTENLDDNNNLYRFPSASPVKSLPGRSPLSKNTENIPREKESLFKLPHFSRRTPKKHDLIESQVTTDMMEEDKEKAIYSRKISQEDMEEIWKNIILIHCSLLTITKYHYETNIGMSLLFLYIHLGPKSNDMNQPTYVGFERDVFRTVADYFLHLPEPLLTFEYYELFVNILVVCGYITIPNRPSGKHTIQDKVCDPHLSFKDKKKKLKQVRKETACPFSSFEHN
uniref:DEP domain containing 1 n=1 Tax=Sphenodon punctatus TaxID=8508 RepID=A0A8D0G9H0_SPHPU